MNEVKLTLCSSLEKIFPDTTLPASGWERASALRGEEFAFQAVLRGPGWGTKEYSWALSSPFGAAAEVFQVEPVPCCLPAYPTRHDGDYLSVKPGLFPDLLRPLGEKVTVSSFQNTVLWVNVKVPEDFPAGEYPLTFSLKGGDAEVSAVFTLKVIPAALPPQKLLFTQWFHTDCLADWYGVKPWSPAHWEIVENYLREAAAEGMNTLLAPVLTPPLDTEPGSERPCVQLAEIWREGGAWRFDFSQVRRFMELAQSCGVTHFEVSHLYSQWGAKSAPSIYAVENGEKRRVFGWETPADSPAYEEFLRQFLPALAGFFREMGLEDRVFFHISDEPGKDDLETYRRHVELVASLIGEFPVMDALSDPDFYDRGLVKRPVCATDHIGPFLERNVPGLWAYNCCSQCVDVGNRFLAMPSYRNRILGLQLYKFHIAGFLHWGYNFWYSQNSRHRIDPFRVTDGDGAFPGGDPFSVYPGEDGKPLSSLRLKVFHHGLQDMRALELLESLGGRKAAEETVPGFDKLTFMDYSRDPPYLLQTREAVNRRIEELMIERE